jgi:ActR/RegA family two-component response regulator
MIRRTRQQRTDIARAAAFVHGQLGDLRLETKIRDHVAFVIQLCDGNQSLAADLLGLHRRTLQRIMQRVERGAGTTGSRFKAPRSRGRTRQPR